MAGDAPLLSVATLESDGAVRLSREYDNPDPSKVETP